jgi:simple sugar transport system permease protein
MSSMCGDGSILIRDRGMTRVKKAVVSNIVPIVFTVLCVLGIVYSKVNLPFILMDVVNRFDRNAILAVSLIIPIRTGMGLNFGIVLGAMAGQAGLFCSCLLGVGGLAGILLATAIAIPLSTLFGWLSGALLNKTKGQEMITSMILGFFATGLYQFVFLFVLGGVIKINAPDLMLTNGVGVRNTIDLLSMKYAIDNMKIFGMSTKVDIFLATAIFCGVYLAIMAIRLISRKATLRASLGKMVAAVLALAICVVARDQGFFKPYKTLVRVPLASFVVIAAVCGVIAALMKTKIGQDMRAVGHSLPVSAVAGIDVNKTRTVATCISTVLAAVGQIIFLQNLGNLNTYNAHENVGMFAAAALLIGGASVERATIGQALIGTTLFHLLFNVSPMAGRNIFGDSIIGEYFRVCIAYGVIAVTLALYAWKQSMQKREGLKQQ